MGKDKTTKGLNVGNIAPDFSLASNGTTTHELSDYKGKYVLLSFWASYDASSRLMNATLNHTLRTSSAATDVAMVSSIFQETVRRDGIKGAACLVDTKGEASGLFREYHLNRGFANYLLDDNGVIVAKNLSASQLSDFLESLSRP